MNTKQVQTYQIVPRIILNYNIDKMGIFTILFSQNSKKDIRLTSFNAVKVKNESHTFTPSPVSLAWLRQNDKNIKSYYELPTVNSQLQTHKLYFSQFSRLDKTEGYVNIPSENCQGGYLVTLSRIKQLISGCERVKKRFFHGKKCVYFKRD